MATESPTKTFSMDMHPPPSYRGNDRTTMYVTALTVVAVAILVGFFGIFYLLLSLPAPAVVNTVNNDIDAVTSPVIEREVIYEMEDGVEHIEKMTAEGETLTIRSIDDGFVAIFDHGRNIAVFKNTTSGACYFTRLENIPQVDLDHIDDMPPVYFHETSEAAQIRADPNVVVLTFDQTSVIPTGYMDVTNNEKVSSQCMDGAYWVNPRDGHVKKRVAPALVVFFLLIPVAAY